MVLHQYESILSKLLALVFFSGACVSAQTYNINLHKTGGTTLDGLAYSSTTAPSSYPGTKWNDLNPDIDSLNLLDSEGNVSTIDFLTDPNGANSFEGSTVSLSLMKGYSPTGTHTSGGGKTYTLSGLSPGSTWDLYVAAHGNQPDQDTTVTIDGVARSTTANWDISSTVWVEGDNYVLFKGILADSSGQIQIDWKGIGNWGAINGMQLVSVATPQESTLLTGLTAYWNFDGNLFDHAHGVLGSSSLIADDGIFDGLNGTDGVSYGSALFGSNSLFLNGADGANANDGHVRVSGSTDTHFGTNDMLSISAWFKVENFNTKFVTIIAHGEQNEYRIARRIATNTIYYAGGGLDIVGPNNQPNVNDGNWHHVVAITESEVGTRLYIDGQIIATGVNSNIVDALGVDLLIGANPETDNANREWDGYIDDVALWDRLLTHSEITYLYNNGTGRSLGSLLLELTDYAFLPVENSASFGADAMILNSIGLNQTVGTLTATPNPNAVTYSLVSGPGSDDNSKYTIGGANGDEIQANVDFSTFTEETHTIRVRGELGSTIIEQVYTFSILEDFDADNLSDAFELQYVGNLSLLTGLLSGPGPGSNTGNYDGDSLVDREEFLYGYDPTNHDYDLEPGLDSIGVLGAYFDGALPSSSPNAGGNDWGSENVFTGISLQPLIGLAVEPNSTFIHALERAGVLQRLDYSDPDNTSKVEFLNISNRVVQNANGGLRSVVFHPEYNQPASPNRNYLYATYTTQAHPSNGSFTSSDEAFFIRLSRFTRNESTGLADPSSELVMIQQRTVDRGQHLGLGLGFDQDGYLVMTWGDTEFNQSQIGVPLYQDAQRIDRIFQCSVLRIDVDQNPSTSSVVTRTLQGNAGPNAIAGTSQSLPNSHHYYHIDSFSGVGYRIPNDNYFKLNPPASGSSAFADTPTHGDALEEHHALGLRNPWRLTVDPVDGDVAWFNVGSNRNPRYEEVEILRPGGNYGWPYFEGDVSKTIETGRSKPPSQYAPIYLGVETTATTFYDHSDGSLSITGGVFYYGSDFPSLYGKLLYADVYTGKVWSHLYKGLTTPVTSELVDLDINPLQMAVDHSGDDILFATGSEIRRLTNASPVVPEPPALLSSTGIFTDMATLTPDPRLIPYEPAAPLWSDRAAKLRWVAIPNTEGLDGVYDQASERIGYTETGNWTFPIGSTFIKHFDLPLDESDAENPAKLRPVETRFLVRGSNGDYHAFTYKWRPDGTEADLLTAGDTADITIVRADDTTYTQTWQYPSRSQCFECHQDAAGIVLGAKSRQLNHPIHYPATGRTSNQLMTLFDLGLIDDETLDIGDLQTLPTSTNLSDTDSPIEHRIRSYMDSNCAMCHNPESNAGLAQFDMRLTTSLDETGLINGAQLAGNLGKIDPKIIDPGDVENSLVYLRDNTTDIATRMPPVGRLMTDDAYLELLAAWIEQVGIDNYNTWAKSHGVTGTLLDDDDGDAVSNIVEFVFGLNPNAGDGNQGAQLEWEGNDMVFTVPIEGDALADGVVISIEDSGDLVNWYEAGTLNSRVEIIQNTATSGVDGILKVRMLAGTDKRFLRVSVEAP